MTSDEANSTYSCKFGLKQKITDPSELTEAGLYNAKYAGNLDYQQWETREADLDNHIVDTLTIFEGVNEAGGIRFNFGMKPDPVKPGEDLDLSTVSGDENPGPLFTNYPTASDDEGAIGGGDEQENRNPLN